MICFTFFISFFLYIESDLSRINYIKISGLKYFDKDDIYELANINNDDLFLLTFSSLIKTKLIKNEMITDVSVYKDKQRNLNIVIKEKRLLAYLYDEEPYFITEDGHLLLMNQEKQSLIVNLPLIVDIEIDKLSSIALALANLSDDIINNITEIHHYESSYDENMLKIIMIDGNQLFTSLSAIDTVNNYFSFVKALNLTNSCIFIDESSKTAYSSSCPLVP